MDAEGSAEAFAEDAEEASRWLGAASSSWEWRRVLYGPLEDSEDSVRALQGLAEVSRSKVQQTGMQQSLIRNTRNPGLENGKLTRSLRKEKPELWTLSPKPNATCPRPIEC